MCHALYIRRRMMAATTFLSASIILFFIVYHLFAVPYFYMANNNVNCYLDRQPGNTLHAVLLVNSMVICSSPLNVCRLTSLRLKSGFFKSRFAVGKISKHGYTSLFIPGHDPPIDITISMDIYSNPGPSFIPQGINGSTIIKASNQLPLFFG